MKFSAATALVIADEMTELRHGVAVKSSRSGRDKWRTSLGNKDQEARSQRLSDLTQS
ncbi:MAG: hypothetical protein Q7S58_06720 [Candidatus Binatus sp.]|uniref:hypothetical protein n=1 Tax=Candidatus Binatus sp. TaxID=2811406 RepID=UPI00271E4740|nr:hypothetical protein [Candidatus Binatus sp.]MDO8432090.1 hypothetical protein [Candidatus Binatus sp.]